MNFEVGIAGSSCGRGENVLVPLLFLVYAENLPLWSPMSVRSRPRA